MEKEIVARDLVNQAAVGFEPSMMNRHGMIAGATGTGKTVTVRLLVERLSALGTHCFLADVKGDLSGLAAAGASTDKLTERMQRVGLSDLAFRAAPVHFWDPLGMQGLPLRTTIAALGPALVARLLKLNDTQTGIIQIAMKVAAREGVTIVNLQDLRAILQYVSEHAREFSAEFGNIAPASVAAIQRSLLALEEEGAETFLGEPSLAVEDLMAPSHAGSVHVMVADTLIERPKTYATLLLYVLSQLYEKLPEVGDLEVPKFAFFFDEAHLLFDDCPDVLLDKIEQVVRLIRSKGVGVFFISQSINDIPPKILAQLGNRIQHGVRAFTDKERKAIKLIAQNFRSEGFDISEALTALGVGEAIVSFLDKEGKPQVASKALIYPPVTRFQPLTPEERQQCIAHDALKARYGQTIARTPVAELLQKQSGKTVKEEGAAVRRSNRETPLEAFFTSAVRSIGNQVGRAIMRSIFKSR